LYNHLVPMFMCMVHGALYNPLLSFPGPRFNNHMHRRDHCGSLEVDDAKQELSLVVQVKGRFDQNAKKVTDLKQLSGKSPLYIPRIEGVF